MCSASENTSTVASLEFTGQSIHKTARAIFATVGCVMVLAGVVGNCLLIAVIFKRFPRKQCVHNLFIANLALADILTLGYWLTFFVLDLILGYHPIVDDAHCVVNGVIIAVLCLVSATSLLSISLNRYLHVCYPHLYSRIFTLPRTVVCCVATWILGMVLGLPPAWSIAGSYRYNPETHMCSFSREDRVSYPKIIVILFSTVPMLFIGYWNFAIFRFWKQARMSLTSRYPLVRNEEMRRRKLISKWTAGLKMKKKSPDLGDTEKKSEAGLEKAQSEKDEESSDLGAEETPSASDKNDSETTVPPETSMSKNGTKKRETPEGDSENCFRSLGDPVQNDDGSGEECDETASLSAGEERKLVLYAQSAIISAGHCSKMQMDQSQEGSETGSSDDELDHKAEKTIPARRLMAELEGAPEDVPKRPPERVLGGNEAASSLATILTPTSPALTYQRRPKFTRSPTRCQKQQACSPAMQHLRRQQRKKKAREVAFVRSLFVVFILMFISFIPFGVIIIVSSFFENVPPEVVILGNMLLFFNNSINWIVYGAMNPAFRKGYMKYVREVLITCCRVGRKRTERYLNTSLSSLTTASSQQMRTENDLVASFVSQGDSGVI